LVCFTKACFPKGSLRIELLDIRFHEIYIQQLQLTCKQRFQSAIT
jgi:hypothetical protein